MIDISGFGTGITVVSTSSFPLGFKITEFSDDVDPVVSEPVEAVGYRPLYDGRIFTYAKTAPISVSISVIPGSSDDINLKILLQEQLAKKGAISNALSSLFGAAATTSMVAVYGGGGFVILSSGSILSGPVMDGIQAQGRKSSNAYRFIFGSFAGAQSPLEAVAGIAQAAAEFTGL